MMTLETFETLREIHAHANLIARDTSYPVAVRANMNALTAVLTFHSPKMQFEMKDGIHDYTCTGCNTPITTTTYPCKTLRELVASYRNTTL